MPPYRRMNGKRSIESAVAGKKREATNLKMEQIRNEVGAASLPDVRKGLWEGKGIKKE